MIRNTVTSPDGKTIVFSALGYIWTKKLPKGTPKRLTNSSDFEFANLFSPDGKDIVYVTWNDENLGNIYKTSINGGNATQLNSTKGIFRTPDYSNDGSKIVYIKEAGNSDQGYTYSKKTGIYVMDSNGNNTKFILKEGTNPVFNQDGNRIIYQTGGAYFGDLTKTLKSVDFSGKDEKTLVSSKYGNRLVLSPDNKWIAFSNLHKAYIGPLPKSGKTLNFDLKKGAKTFVPLFRRYQKMLV
tara:strand:+ start:10387 stop:11106 length:720 start_codon:yes stop_codon:yes gene_type:complete